MCGRWPSGVFHRRRRADGRGARGLSLPLDPSCSTTYHLWNEIKGTATTFIGHLNFLRFFSLDLFSVNQSVPALLLRAAVDLNSSPPHWADCLQIGKVMSSRRWDEGAGPTAVFFVDMLKWLRLQPLAALLMTPFLASCTLCSSKLWEEEMSINHLPPFFPPTSVHELHLSWAQVNGVHNCR